MTLSLLLIVAAPIAAAVYAYLLYPLVLWLVRRDWKSAVEGTPGYQPLVTFVVPAYNERGQIRGAIERLLAQEYPAELRQILVVSDASTDGTDDVAREFAQQGVELLRLEERGGKTAAENRAAARIRGEIVINTDASVRLHPSATSRLVQALSDPSVGVASTRDVSIAAASSEAGAEARYVGYEMWVRSLETSAGGIIGASGSGYAIRAALHKLPVREDLSRDFSSALTAHRHGMRAVSVDDGITYVPRTQSVQREYRRKVRTISRGLRTLYANRDLLNPFTHGLFAVKLFSHKLMRWLVPPLAVPALLILAAVAVRDRPLWSMLGLAIIVAGLLLSRTVAAIVAANAAVVHAVFRFLFARDERIWEPTRRAPTAVLAVPEQ